MICEPVVPHGDVLADPGLFVAAACRRPLPEPVPQLGEDRPAMDEGIVDDEHRERAREAVVASPAQRRLKVAALEEEVLGRAHDRIFVAGAAQQVLECVVVDERRPADLSMKGRNLAENGPFASAYI